jgi:hypothetical protein
MVGTAAAAESSSGAPVDVRESAIRAAVAQAAVILVVEGPVADIRAVATRAAATVTTKTIWK